MVLTTSKLVSELITSLKPKLRSKAGEEPVNPLISIIFLSSFDNDAK